MSNYHLYRTNVKLGGQMKWDLKLESVDDELYITDFKLSPISELVPFNRYADSDALNYSILENIKAYYKRMQGSFYQEHVDPDLISLDPIVIKGDKARSEYKDLHSNTFEMGLKRAKYSIHNKQFEFLCPIWLEDVVDVNSVSFIMTMRSLNKQGKWLDICKKIIHLNNRGVSGHDKFVGRFQEYINTIKPDNNCMTIDFKNNSAYITGIHAPTGLMKTSRMINLPTNLLQQERLMMEFDNLILQEYENREMIVKQLINFNFIFDLDEILPASLRSTILGQDITINFTPVVDEKILEMRDFDSRYEFIPCENGDEQKPKVNVYAEILDHMNVDLTTKNKIQQSIIHWSLADREDYIFNLYPGFGGILADGTKLKKVYGNAPDITMIPYSIDDARSSNSINWLKWVDDDLNINNGADISKLSPHEYDYSLQACELSEWQNNIRHKNKYPLPGGLKLAFILYKTSGVVIDSIKKCVDNGQLMAMGSNTGIYYTTLRSIDENGMFSSIVLILVGNTVLYNAAFTKFRIILNDYISTNNTNPYVELWMKPLLSWMNDSEEPSAFCFNNVLRYRRADSPDIQTKEVQHYKYQDQQEYLLRYDGKIKPCLISLNGTESELFTKVVIREGELEKSIFAELNPIGFEKKYPSIGYYPYQKHALCNVDDRMMVDNKPPTETLDLPYEYKWFAESSCIYISPSLSCYIITEDSGEIAGYMQLKKYPELYWKWSEEGHTIYVKSSRVGHTIIDRDILNELIIMYISCIYNTDEDKSRYIYAQYDQMIDWEYMSRTDINNYIYTIKLTLK